MPEPPKVPNSAGEQDAAAQPRAFTLRKAALWGTLTTVLYLAGLAAGTGMQAWSSTASEIRLVQDTAGETGTVAGESLPETAVPPFPTVPADVQSAANAMTWGDSLLMAGNAAAALKQYQVPAVLPAGQLPAGLRYRMALCAEMLGDLDRARIEYGQLSNRPDAPRVEAAARLGQVRIWLSLDHATLARQLLWKLILAPQDSPATPTDAQAEYAEQLAQILARQARPEVLPRLWDDRGIVDPVLARSPRDMLLRVADDQPPPSPPPVDGESQSASAEPSRDHTSPTSGAPIDSASRPPSVNPGRPLPDRTREQVAESVGPAIEVTRAIGLEPEEIYVRVVVPNAPAAFVLERLTKQADLLLKWQTAAREAISGHMTEVRAADISLAMILDGVLDSLDLMWVTRDGVVTIQTRQEASGEELASFRRAMAERMLRHVLTRFPEHELTDEAYWALGNLNFDADLPDAAIVEYEQYLRQFPESRYRTGVHFNLAKAYLLQQQRSRALQHFYHVVDGAISESHLLPAYLYVGRLSMEEDLAVRACKPLTRGLALATAVTDEALTALELSAAYLMCDNPHSANRVLMDHRTVLAAEPFCDRASLLAAIARYRAAPTLALRKKEGRTLITALTHVKPTDFYGSHGYLLLADAYRNLGFLGQSQALLDQGLLQEPQGAIRHRMTYALAECHLRAGDPETCRKLLNQLVHEDDGPWRRRATLELAKLAFQAGDDNACNRFCELLLEDTEDDADRKDILLIAGRLLQRQGNYHGAALCFAGVSPYSSQPLNDAQEQPN